MQTPRVIFHLPIIRIYAQHSMLNRLITNVYSKLKAIKMRQNIFRKNKTRRKYQVELRNSSDKGQPVLYVFRQ